MTAEDNGAVSSPDAGPAPAGDALPDVRAYGLSRPVALRLLGGVLVVLGAAVLVVAVLVAALSLPSVVLLVAALVSLFVLLGVGGVLVGRIWLVRLDRDGYRVRGVRGVGRPGARWSDVEDAVVTKIAGEPCVVLRLRNGDASTVPVRMLDVDPEAFVRELRQRLDIGRGYQRLR